MTETYNLEARPNCYYCQWWFKFAGLMVECFCSWEFLLIYWRVCFKRKARSNGLFMINVNHVDSLQTDIRRFKIRIILDTSSLMIVPFDFNAQLKTNRQHVSKVFRMRGREHLKFSTFSLSKAKDVYYFLYFPSEDERHDASNDTRWLSSG